MDTPVDITQDETLQSANVNGSNPKNKKKAKKNANKAAAQTTEITDEVEQNGKKRSLFRGEVGSQICFIYSIRK